MIIDIQKSEDLLILCSLLDCIVWLESQKQANNIHVQKRKKTHEELFILSDNLSKHTFFLHSHNGKSLIRVIPDESLDWYNFLDWKQKVVFNKKQDKFFVFLTCESLIIPSIPKLKLEKQEIPGVTLCCRIHRSLLPIIG